MSDLITTTEPAWTDHSAREQYEYLMGKITEHMALPEFVSGYSPKLIDAMRMRRYIETEPMREMCVKLVSRYTVPRLIVKVGP